MRLQMFKNTGHGKIYSSIIIGMMLMPCMVKAQSITVFKMSNTPAFTTDIFRTVAVGKGGYIYAGTLRQGLYKYDGNAWQKLPLLTNNSINDIQHDDFGGIWVAQSGYNSGSNQAITGGINYFPDSTSAGYFAYGSADGVLTRNCRGIFVDNQGYFINNRPRIWGAHLPDVTGGVSKSGGVSVGLNASTPFFSLRPGTDSTNKLGSAQSIGGNETEVWVYASANYGKSQILRYNALTSSFIGTYDYTNVPALAADFNAKSILFDRDGRQWIGLSTGGLIIKNGNSWVSANMPTIFPAGTIINNNAIFEDSKGKIYVGTSNGLAIYSGGIIDAESSWKLMTTLDSLPHNNIFDICENESTGTIVIAGTGGIAFLNENIKAELVWDNSFPQISYPKPKGVAADGVSRLYIKVTGGQGTPNLQKVDISIIDVLSKTDNIKGKVKKTVLPVYTYNEEAGGGGQTATDEFFPGKAEFWFWYVSPDDYCNLNSVYSLTPERKETVKVVITFANGTKDSTELDILIVRPPLVLVHGLASGPQAWDNFRYNGGNILGNGLFKHTKALKLSGKASFKDNARLLLDELNPSSLQYNINTMREKGYASNQVDYVCHSMGGLMLRTAIEFFPKYKGSSSYKNYGKGYVHKLITINTPHNSSPVADFLTEYIPQLQGESRLVLSGIYKMFPTKQQPFDFIEPEIKTNIGLLVSPFKATPAVRNLQVRSATGGVDLGPTVVKNHMIAGNVNWGNPGVARFISGVDPLLEIIEKTLDAARDKTVTTADKIFVNSLYALNKAARAWSFLEWYSAKLGYPNFLGSSDLIVPLASQVAKQTIGVPHITTFGNSPGSFYDANHVAIVDRIEVGNKVMDLLDSPVSSNVFASQIPGNTDPEPAAFRVVKTVSKPQSVLADIPSQYSNAKIEITSPATGSAPLLADSALQVKIQLKDTVGLAYFRVYFQDADTATISRLANQTFSFRVNPSFSDTQTIRAVAVYDKPGQVEYHVDTLIKVVTNAAIADSFRLKTDTTVLTAGEAYYPEIEIHYSGKWVSIPVTSPQLVVQVQNTTILNYDANKSFIGLLQGKSRVYFSYLSFKDTLKLEVNPALYENSVIYTIASGNLTNPLTWNKGRAPFDTDSIVVRSGHILTIDSAIQIRAIKVEAGGSVQVGDTLKIGENSTSMIDGDPLNYRAEESVCREIKNSGFVVEYIANTILSYDRISRELSAYHHKSSLPVPGFDLINPVSTKV